MNQPTRSYADLFKAERCRVVSFLSSGMNPELSTRQIAKQVGLKSHSTVVEALRVVGKVEDSTAKPTTPSHITERHAIAEFEQLSPEGQVLFRQNWRNCLTLASKLSARR